MDRILSVLGHSENSFRPEVYIAYGAVAVLVSFFVNWALALLIYMLKPFTCAAIMMAFIRPDLAQTFMQEEYLRLIMEKMKILFFGLMDFILHLGQQFHEKFIY